MFFDEITKSLKQDISALKDFSYTNVANKGVFVNGKNTIEVFSSCKIVLKFAKHKLYIFGNNLKIETMNQTSFCVCGDIFCISDREVNL